MKAARTRAWRRAGHWFALALAALVVFVAMAVSALSGRWAALDAAAQAVARSAAAQPGALAAWRVISALHAPRAIALWTTCAAALLLARRRAPAAAALGLVVFGGATCMHLVKHALQRPRPGLAELAGAGTDFALPSGHVVNATLLYAALLAAAWPALRRARWRAGASGIAALAIAAVAASRVVLGAHRLSDVLAGPPLALAWLAACLAAAAAWRARRKQETETDEPCR